jgi:predicted MFS family arabinose efflux permease
LAGVVVGFQGMRRGALGETAFRLLFIGQAVSALGDRLVSVALAFAVLDLTGSVTDLGIILTAQTVPVVALVLVGGMWADRLPRQRVMLVSDVVRAGAQGASAVLLLTGNAHVWQLAGLQALYGMADAFFVPATTGLVPQTVGPEHLQQANALIGLTGNLAQVIGPALAGVLVATIGPNWGLAIDGATFAVSAVFLGVMRVAPTEGTPRERPWVELRAGWHAFRSRTWLWVSVAFFTLFISFVLSPFQVLGPQVARLALGGPAAWAAISTAIGLGAVLGGTLGLRWRPRYPLRTCFISFLIAGPAMLALLAAHAPLWIILVTGLVDGATGPLFNVLWYTAIQQEIPAGELSRVSSWDYLGTLALQPVGLAVSGPIAIAVGLSTTLYAAGILFLVLVLAVLAVPSVRNFTWASPREARYERQSSEAV